VHNTETRESFWRFPEDVMKGVIEFDTKERGRRERKERGEPSEDGDSEAERQRKELEEPEKDEDEGSSE
jgi:hypothetical protein